MSYREGSPLDLVQKKIDELEKENGRVTAAIKTYTELFKKLDKDLPVNLSDVLKLQKLGSREFNTEIEKRKGNYLAGATAKYHEIDENGLYCKNCGMNVYDATLVNCPNNTSAASQPSSSHGANLLIPYVPPSSAFIPIPPPFPLPPDPYVPPSGGHTTYSTSGRLKKSTLRKHRTHLKKRTLHKRR